MSSRPLQEYKQKLARVTQVRKELKSHIQSLPDLSLLPNVTGGLAPLPSAGDLFSTDWAVFAQTYGPPAPPRPNPAPCLIHKILLAVPPARGHTRRDLQDKKGHHKEGLVKSECSAEENRDSVSLDFFSSSMDKDSTPPAWNEFVSCLFLFYVLMPEMSVS